MHWLSRIRDDGSTEVHWHCRVYEDEQIVIFWLGQYAKLDYSFTDTFIQDRPFVVYSLD